MHALITNDDGIDSEGIHVLARFVEQAGFEVTVIAPSYNASGTGASLGHLSLETPIKYQAHTIEGLNGKAYGLDGPPALCTITGHLEGLCKAPDIVVSGINAGLNTGRSVLHSGTVGAALAAQNFGMRGIAVSLDTADEWFWETAGSLTADLLPALVEGPERCVLNLNVPALPLDAVKGIRWAGLAAFGSVRSHITDSKEGALFFDLVETDYEPPLETDLGLVRSGYAAITALHGTSEVWHNRAEPGDKFESEQGVPGASARDRLTAATSHLV